MKWNHWIIVLVLLLLIALGGMMELNTTIGQQEALLIAQQQETDRLAAEIYWTGIKNRPLLYYQPMADIWISSGCGYRMDPMGGTTERLHKGVDLVGPIGTPIRAVLPGRVMDHWLVPGLHYGKMYYGHSELGGAIILNHGDGLFSIYGHFSATFVHEGDWIEAGEVIGELGNTGISTGPHLHFEIVVDPLRYLETR